MLCIQPSSVILTQEGAARPDRSYALDRHGMNTPVTSNNPFGPTRQGFAWAHVPATSSRHLDFGCYDGKLLDALHDKGVGRLIGIDVSRDALDAGRREYPDLELVHATRTVPLPFADATFSSITILDVLEHLHRDDQDELLAEFHRVLAADGLLVVTVPRQHVFSFLDKGNLKFRFPRLHRWFYCLRHTREEYEYRYVSNPDGLVGDVSGKKRWHEHFTPDGLRALLAPAGFEPATFDGSGLFTRPLSWLRAPVAAIPPLTRMFDAMIRRDAQRFSAMNLFCVARKAGES